MQDSYAHENVTGEGQNILDRRQQKTRDAIFEAFTRLLAQKSYSRLTVQEIIDEANIGRSTFYAHFESKDELLREMCTDLFAHVFSGSLHSEKTHDFSLKSKDPEAMIAHILYHLRDNKKNILQILGSESGELFTGFFRQYLNQMLSRGLIETLPVRDVPEDFLINHLSSSFIGMVQWWIANSLEQSPEQLAAWFIEVIQGQPHPAGLTPGHSYNP